MPKVWEEYVRAIGQGDIVTRSAMAEIMGVCKNTAAYHLERAVNAGALHKQLGWAGNQGGWVYALPDTMPQLEGFDNAPEN